MIRWNWHYSMVQDERSIGANMLCALEILVSPVSIFFYLTMAFISVCWSVAKLICLTVNSNYLGTIYFLVHCRGQVLIWGSCANYCSFLVDFVQVNDTTFYNLYSQVALDATQVVLKDFWLTSTIMKVKWMKSFSIPVGLDTTSWDTPNCWTWLEPGVSSCRYLQFWCGIQPDSEFSQERAYR